MLGQERPSTPPHRRYTDTVDRPALPVRQWWARDMVAASHDQALWSYGEYAIFALLWTAQDFDAGLCRKCATCVGKGSRVFAAYDQPAENKCPECFGTTFSGVRALLVRPALWADGGAIFSTGPRGQQTSEDVPVETTEDFTLHTGDYIFRAVGTRYRVAVSGNQVFLRTGFQDPHDGVDSIALQLRSARLEPASSVAYIIPPPPEKVVAALRTPVRRPMTFPDVEVVNGPLIV